VYGPVRTVVWQGSAGDRRPYADQTGFVAISLQLNDHTDRGLGGRQYGTSKDIEAL